MRDWQNIESMSVEELDALNVGLMAQRAEIQADQRRVAGILDRKRREADLQADIEALQQKHGVKAQVIAPEGIASGESVNGGAV